MNKTNYSQLELFSGSGEPATPVKRQEQNQFLVFLKNHEKSILLIIGFLTTATLAYCIGIERGKKTARVYQTSFIDVASKPQGEVPTVEAKTPSMALASQPVPAKGSLQEPGTGLDAYTVQVATFQTKKLAQKAAEALKNRGHAPIILSKGKYTIVCVGSFPNKEKARPLLSELKKTFHDCYIRRL